MKLNKILQQSVLSFLFLWWTSLNASPYSVEIHSVKGDLANDKDIGEATFTLSHQPTSIVYISLKTNVFYMELENREFVFTPENWDIPQKISVFRSGEGPLLEEINEEQVLFDSITSSDTNYNGLLIAPITFIPPHLSIIEPKSISLEAAIPQTYSPNVMYNDFGVLEFTAQNAPEGFEIDPKSGLISWTPVEGNQTHIVKVIVSDGSLFAEENLHFNIREPRSLATINSVAIDGSKYLKILDDDTTVKNLTIKIPSTDIKSPKVFLHENAYIPNIPSHLNQFSEVITIKDTLYNTRAIFKLSGIGSINPKLFNIYTYSQASDIDGRAWLSLGRSREIVYEDGVPHLEVDIPTLHGTYFIGYETRSAMLKHFKGPTSTQLTNITCEPSSTFFGQDDYSNQTCTKNGSVFEIEGFGDAKDSVRWSNNTIYDLVDWLSESQHNLDRLGMTYARNIEVKIEPLKDYVLGFVSPNDDFDVLHLRDVLPKGSIAKMRGVVAHEYFHHAQANTIGGGLTSIFDKGGLAYVRWIIESTATWFEDLYDFDIDQNYLKYGSIDQVLEVGLNKKIGRKYTDNKMSPYNRYLFIKLLENRCTDFKKLSHRFFSVYSMKSDNSAVKNFKNTLQNMGCYFPHYHGNDLFSAAMLEYQWATYIENNSTLIESDETVTITGRDNEILHTQGLVNKRWKHQGESAILDINDFNEIPANGAITIPIYLMTWGGMSGYDEGVFEIETENGEKPIYVSMLSTQPTLYDPSNSSYFKGTNYIHKYIRTDKQRSFVFNRYQTFDMSFTLVNQNNHNISIKSMRLVKRKTLDKPITITSHVNNESVNRRVISIRGTVPQNTRNFDRVIIKNGDIRKVAPIYDGDKFATSVVMMMGDNTITAYGAKSSDLNTPLTEESIINLHGVESLTDSRNALIKSKATFVLQWYSNNSDLDIYTKDSNGRHVWFDNPTNYPARLDYDNVDGYGPEVISYRSVDNYSAFQNGYINVDVHYFSGSIATYFTIHTILNEDNPSLRKNFHYSSRYPIQKGNPSQRGPNVPGDSRRNNIIRVYCDTNKKCSISSAKDFVTKPIGVESVELTSPILSLPASDTDGGYKVSWNSVSGTTSYVLQKRKLNDDWNDHITTDASYYRDNSSSGIYEYRVKACIDVSCSDYSDVKSIAVFIKPPSCGFRCIEER